MSDAKPLTEAVTWRLHLAHLALTEGREAAEDPLPFSRMRAVLLLDHATEMALWTLLSQAGKLPKGEPHLPELLRILLDSHPALESHRGPVSAARSLRNHVAHAGTVPSPEDARRIAVEIEAFIRAALDAVLGITVESVTPAALVEDGKTKEHIFAAEAALQKGDYPEAIRRAAIALYLARIGLKKKTGFREVSAIASGLASATERALQRAGLHGVSLDAFRDDISIALTPLGDIVLAIESDISLNELRWFREVTPIVAVSTSGRTHTLQHAPSSSETKETATRVLDFATRAVLRFEAQARRIP